jgi:glyoxylase-like metal-dependent hydrolase (beta-lactamase superfamily II)
MDIKAFYDDRSSTMTYVVFDADTKDAVVIDPVLDYEPKASKTWTESADAVIDFVKSNSLDLHYILETHAHADHLSGSQIIQEAFPDARIGVGERITEVQKVFKNVFDLPEDFPTDGRQFDLLLREGGDLEAGSLIIETIFTPGHTAACATYKVDDAIFTGDVMFMPDMGTGRCDFPGGSAHDMYNSIHKLYALPDATRVFVGHDYQPGGRDVQWETTIGEQRERNTQIPAGRSKEEFVKFRSERDATLDAPQLLFQSVQVNVDAGKLPDPSKNEVRYLRIPVNVFKPDPSQGETDLKEV